MHLFALFIHALFIAFFTSAASAQNIVANEEVFRCPEHPATQWNRTEILSSKLTKTGYRIEKIYPTPGGCYEVHAHNASGQAVRLQVDPLSLRPLKIDRASP